jgi:hypothetical protein
MTTDIATVLLLIISLAGLAKVYFDWSGFERGVRRTNFIDSRETKKIAIKIGTTSAIAGLALGLSIVIVRLSSPSGAIEENISSLFYAGYALLCTIGWSLFALFMFGMKVATLRSVYKEKPQE